MRRFDQVHTYHSIPTMLLLSLLWFIGMLLWAVAIARVWKFQVKEFPFAVLGMAIVIFGSVWGYEFFHVPAPIPITIDRLLLVVAIGIFAMLAIRQQASIRQLMPIDLLAICLIGVIFCSAVLHDWSFKNNLPISRLLFFYLLPFGLYLVVKNSTISKKQLRFVGIGICSFCVYLSLTAFAESRGWYGVVFPKYIYDPSVTEFLGRGRGPFQNPISNGVFMTTGLAAAFVLWPNSGTRTRMALTIAIPILILGNYATLTRSVWLGMVLGIGLVVWVITNQRQRAVMIIAGTAASVVIFMALGSSLVSFKRDKHVTQNEMSQSALLRPIFASIAWEMFQDRPVFGHGFGQYSKHRHHYLQNPHSDLPLSKGASYYQHNVFLALLTETGIIGCGLLVLFLLKSFQTSILLYRHPDASNWEQAHALILMALLISYVINGMFHDVSIIPMAHYLLFFWLAIVVSRYQSTVAEATQTQWAEPEPVLHSWGPSGYSADVLSA